MTPFLLLTLYAPLASWGDIAVGERRGSWTWPSRSAVMGLLAAALGIDRTDQDAHDALDSGYGLAVRLDAPGRSLVDYHTAQTVAQAALRRNPPATRKAMLEAGDRETILSWRSYRADALATAALWARPEARWTLSALGDALRRPVFAPYAGRKANPLGLPVNPRLVEAASLADAFAAHSADEVTELSVLRPREGWGREIAHDPTGDIATGLHPVRSETRRDAKPDRRRWQFAERIVEIGRLPETGGDRP